MTIVYCLWGMYAYDDRPHLMGIYAKPELAEKALSANEKAEIEEPTDCSYWVAEEELHVE